MFQHTITYQDFNDVEVTESLYFHLAEADLVRPVEGYPGGLMQAIEHVATAELLVTDENRATVFALLERLVVTSYGIRHADGRRFERTEQIREEFKQTAAYEALMLSLATDQELSVKFFNSLIPKNLQTKEASELASKALAANSRQPRRKK